jgi:hypothetical protein
MRYSVVIPDEWMQVQRSPRWAVARWLIRLAVAVVRAKA